MDTIVNDFTLNIATANGTGSQSANLILLQTIADMGVNVSGKNLFPLIYPAYQLGISFVLQMLDIKHQEIEPTFRY